MDHTIIPSVGNTSSSTGKRAHPVLDAFKKHSSVSKKTLVLLLFLSSMLFGVTANYLNEARAREEFFRSHEPKKSLIERIILSKQYKKVILNEIQNTGSPGIYHIRDLNWILYVTNEEEVCFVHRRKDNEQPSGKWSYLGSGWLGLEMLTEALDRKVFPEIMVKKEKLVRKKWVDPREIVF